MLGIGKDLDVYLVLVLETSYARRLGRDYAATAQLAYTRLDLLH